MDNDLDERLRLAEEFMRQAEEEAKEGDNLHGSVLGIDRVVSVGKAIYLGIKALYEQNQVMIYLNKEKKE